MSTRKTRQYSSRMRTAPWQPYMLWWPPLGVSTGVGGYYRSHTHPLWYTHSPGIPTPLVGKGKHLPEVGSGSKPSESFPPVIENVKWERDKYAMLIPKNWLHFNLLLPSATKLRRLCFYRRLSVHGCPPQCMLGYHTPPGADTPWEQSPPLEQTHTLPGADTPLLPEQTPPRSPPRADTPPPPEIRSLLRMVRILLECILVTYLSTSYLIQIFLFRHFGLFLRYSISVVVVEACSWDVMPELRLWIQQHVEEACLFGYFSKINWYTKYLPSGEHTKLWVN